MTEEFQIGLPDPDAYRRPIKKVIVYDGDTEIYQPWRIIPDSACFTGRAIFCADTLIGSTFIKKMESLAAMRKSDVNGIEEVCIEAGKILLLNQKVLYAFKSLLNIWRFKNLRTMNQEDPITLSVPSNAVHIITPKYRFVYEAESIALDIHKRLLHHDGQIPYPLEPRNLLTNEPMSLQQMISVIDQCRSFGYSYWTLEAFKKSSYCIEDFVRVQRNPLRYSAIIKIINNPLDPDGIDTITDFIQTQFDYHNIPYPTTTYIWALRHIPADSMIIQWKSLCKKWFSCLIFDGITPSIEHTTEILCKNWRVLRDKMLEAKKPTMIPSQP